mmetsp:Transcript_30379/g.61167  ORF Transcript_30379/g.61167 Transcript_30379/m.61167 type:complete len:95 (+) Transcript_30379:63-347(+)
MSDNGGVTTMQSNALVKTTLFNEDDTKRSASAESWFSLEEEDDHEHVATQKSYAFSGQGSPLPKSPLRTGIRDEHNAQIGQWLDEETVPSVSRA